MAKQYLTVSTPFPPLAYSIKDVTQQLGLSRAQINKMIANGELKARRAGRRVLIPRTALVEWLESKNSGSF